MDYIDDRIPDYILSNVNFPLSYSTYPAYYSYEITGNGIDRNGDVTRAADSQTVTVKVTVSYNGETGTRELQKTVVGTSPAAEGTYFQTMLAQELKDAYGIGADTPPAQLTNEQPLDLSVLLAELNTATVNTITVTGDSFEWNAETKYLTLKPHLAAGTLTVSCGGETGTYAVPRSSDETIVNFLDEQFPVPYFKEYDDADGNRVRVEEVRLFANEVTNKALTLADQTTCKYADDISFSYAFESDGTAVNIDDLAFLSWEENGVLKMDASSYKGEKVYVTLEVTIGAETYNIQREIILSVSNGFGGNETSFQNANLNPFGGEALGSFTHTIPDMYIAVELLNDSLGDAIQITTDKTDAYVQTVTISWRTNGNTYPFLIIDNGQRNGNFVPAGYSVTIKIENVPDFDVLLSLRVKMYNSAVNKISNTVQTSRDVYLTIPGILYYNTGNAGVAPREFKDAEFYGEIVKTTQNVPETDGACLSDAGYGVFRFTEEGNAKYVLLASGAGNAVEQLVYQNASAPATDITGIHYLTGTKSFNFANTELNSLEPFSRFTLTDNAVETLTLTNCGITDAKIWNGDVSYLYALNRLQMVDLSNNAIQTVAKGRNTVVYRTVTNMNLSDNQITELAGVENILKLQTLDISNNRINSFNDLKYCSALKSVYLYGNTSAVTGANGYYGTAGSVNLPVYVLLHDLGVTVYRENGDSPLTFGEGGDITTAQQNLARALNAIAYAKTQRNESLYFANSVTNTDISYTVTPVTVLQINGNTATPYAVTTGNTNTVSFTGAKPNNGTIYLIASITENGTTVYAQYEMTYQGGA